MLMNSMCSIVQRTYGACVLIDSTLSMNSMHSCRCITVDYNMQNKTQLLAIVHEVTIWAHPHTNSIAVHQTHVRITIFSKFFSQLPHGTCFLSVSGICQGFDEAYHQFTFQSKGMLLKYYTPYIESSRSHTGLSPSLARCCKQVPTAP